MWSTHAVKLQVFDSPLQMASLTVRGSKICRANTKADRAGKNLFLPTFSPQLSRHQAISVRTQDQLLAAELGRQVHPWLRPVPSLPTVTPVPAGSPGDSPPLTSVTLNYPAAMSGAQKISFTLLLYIVLLSCKFQPEKQTPLHLLGFSLISCMHNLLAFL